MAPGPGLGTIASTAAKNIGTWIAIVLIVIVGCIAILWVTSYLTNTTLGKTVSDIGLGFIAVVALCSFTILLGFILFPVNTTLAKLVIYGGLFAIMIALSLFEFSLLTSNGGNIIPKYRECPAGDYDLGNLRSGHSSPINTISCWFTGHEATTPFDLVSLSVTGIAVPLVALIYLFVDFVSASGVITDPTSKNVLGVSFGILAYRGFLVSKLIYVLDFGAMGIALLAINFIFMGGLFAYLRRALQNWAPMEQTIKYGGITAQAAENLKVILASFEKMPTVQSILGSLEQPEVEGEFRLLGMEAAHKELIAVCERNSRQSVNTIFPTIESIRRRIR